MRHRKANIKLGRTATHRNAMLRNMATSIFEHGKITTTLSKAKAVKPLVDHVVTLAKRGDLHSIRQVASILRSQVVLKKLFDSAKEQFSDRSSGYLTMVKVGLRKGDVAPMVILQLTTAGQKKATVGIGAPVKVKDRSQRVAASKKVVADESKIVEKTEDVVETQPDGTDKQD